MSGYIGSTPVPQSVQTRDAFIATAGQTSFGSSGYAPGFLDVYLNGIKLASEDYTATNGSDIVLTSGASLDDILEVVAFESFEVANTLPLTGGTFTGDIGITSADPILTIRDTETSTSSSNARLRLAESGAGSSLDNYFDVGFVADKFTIGSNSVADALTIARDTGNTGIGTNTPSAKLELSSSATDHLRLTRSTNNWDVGVGSTGDLITKLGGADIMRIDASGNLLVGKTAIGAGTVGTEIFDTGLMRLTRNENTTLILDRRNSNGHNVEFRYNGTTRGSIGVNDSGVFYGGTGTGLAMNNSQVRIVPWNPSTNAGRDNQIDLGSSSFRFDDIYATNGSIQTSDATEKQDIASLTATEMLVGKRLSGLFKTFRWKDSVASNPNARTHTGTIAQDVQAAFTAEGLDAGDYSLFISTTWWETQTEVPAVEAVEAVDAITETTTDEEGNEVVTVITEAVEAVEAKDAYTRTDTYETLEEAPEGATERTRMGIRYPELLCFVGAYNEQRFATLEVNQTTIEARLTLLEAV